MGSVACSKATKRATAPGFKDDPSSRSVSTVPTFGKLGLPFGKTVFVEGTVHNPQPGAAREYYVAVTVKKVDNIPIDPQVSIDLAVFLGYYKDLEKYPGREIGFYAFEAGRFEGIPEEARKYLPAAPDEPFHFHEFLVGPVDFDVFPR
jgi:hypothetical protein